MSQRLANSKLGPRDKLRAKEPRKLKQSWDWEKKGFFWNRCSTHTVNVTSLILSTEERRESYCDAFISPDQHQPWSSSAVPLHWGRRDTNDRKQCSSPCVSQEMSQYPPQPPCTLHCCRRDGPLKMYNLAEFDTLAQPKNSIQKSFSKIESPTRTLILRCQCRFQSFGFQKSFNTDILLWEKNSLRPWMRRSCHGSRWKTD